MNAYHIKAYWKTRNNPGIEIYIISTSKSGALSVFNEQYGKYYDLISIEEHTLFEGSVLL